uniref:Apple domain-containing protein n=1 Tax=Clytia hemisphaerica TaxID=252671 RepID=A0A7M5UJ30_9CNID
MEFSSLVLCLLSLFVSGCVTHMLKLSECNNYDGKFSKIKYNHRLIGDMLVVIETISLRGCLTKCLYHSVCLTVNYRRDNSTCELLGVAIQVFNPVKNTTLLLAPGWHHYETDYTAKQLGRWCTANKPSCLENERCEDTCGPTRYQCSKGK